MQPALAKHTNPAAATKDQGVSRDHELEQYVHSFTVSSDRVRRLILISLVTSVLVLVAFWNTLPFNWLETRTSMVRVAYRNKLWDNPEGRLQTCRAGGNGGQKAANFVDDCESVAKNVGWVLARRHSEASLKAHLEKLEQLRAERTLVVRVPWLGVDFDINDLGAVSAIALALLSMTLCFAMSRQYENQYLCLWKIRRVANREARYDDGESEANFIYHALVMAQVFSRPPTLACWRPSFLGRLAVLVLLLVPLGVQALVTIHNLWSLEIARGMNPRAASLSMLVQASFLVLVIIFTLLCLIYSRASHILWRETFFAINPDLGRCTCAPWLEWMKLRKEPNWKLMIDGGGNLYAQFTDNIAELDVRSTWSAWKLDLRTNKAVSLTSASELPGSAFRVMDENGDEYRFQPVAADRAVLTLVRITKEGQTEQIAGGMDRMVDGHGSEAGFRSPRAFIGDAERHCLYVLDGAYLRHVDLCSGAVKTLGSKPLGSRPRLLKPRLQGIALASGRLLVADYDENCVRLLGDDGTEHEELYRSRGRWAPAGVAAHNGVVYILEHRPLIVDSLIGYPRSWGRVWCVPMPAPDQSATATPHLLLKISRRGARLALGLPS